MQRRFSGNARATPRKWRVEMRRRGVSLSKGTTLLAIGIVMLLAGIALLWSGLGNPVGAAMPAQVEAGCVQRQTILYDRCGHRVLRQIDAPAAWVGCTREGVSTHLEEGWRITAFSPKVIELRSATALFCPAHWVLMLGEDGSAGVYRNLLGFEMVRMESVRLHMPDEATFAVLARGLAFDSREALDAYIAEFAG